MLPAATRLLEAPTPAISCSSLEPVGRQLHRVDDHLDEILARALQRRLEHAGHFLDAVAQVARRRRQRPLGNIARERHHHDREFRKVDLVDGRLVGALGQVALGVGDLGAHVLERARKVGAGVELDEHVTAALIGGRAHLLDVGEALHPGLDRTQQQPLGILGRDALVAEADIDDRNLDIRLGFLGNRLIRQRAGDQEEHHDGEREPGVADGVADETHGSVLIIQASASSGT